MNAKNLIKKMQKLDWKAIQREVYPMTAKQIKREAEKGMPEKKKRKQ